jgi:RHS repeat-associated protein
MVQAMKAGIPQDAQDNPAMSQALEMMQKSIAAFPEFMQKEMEKNMRQMLEHGLTPQGKAFIGSAMAEQTNSLLKNMAEGLEGQKNKTPIEIHFYHCDHLGTPIALTDKQGQIVWAAKYDPWGNIEEEFDPYDMHQDIRLPGQHHDRETGLYYNRHRYYDPTIGAYINQDPIGLRGGNTNFYGYPTAPLRKTDPLGLFQWHGNWCGPDWTGGREHPFVPNSDPYYYESPVDIVDKACMNHDVCYSLCRDEFPCSTSDRGKCMKECDTNLVEASKGAKRPQGMSTGHKIGLEIVIDRQPAPVGPNASFCSPPPAVGNVGINDFFNSLSGL